MSAHLFASHSRRSLLVATLGLAIPVLAFGLDQTAATSLVVEVYPDHYVSGTERFSDVKALEAWVKPTGSRALRLVSCGPGSTTKQLLAVVERFHDMQIKQLEIGALSGDDPACTGMLTAKARGGVRPVDESEYYATDRHGRSTMP